MGDLVEPTGFAQREGKIKKLCVQAFKARENLGQKRKDPPCGKGDLKKNHPPIPIRRKEMAIGGRTMSPLENGQKKDSLWKACRSAVTVRRATRQKGPTLAVSVILVKKGQSERNPFKSKKRGLGAKL